MNISRLDAHHKLYFSLAISFVCLILTYSKLSVATDSILIWICFSLTYIGLSLVTIFSVHPIEMKQIAKLEDGSRTFIFLFVLFAAVASLFVVLLLLKTTSTLSGTSLFLHILLSVVAVISSWAMVHMIFVFRYAHLYYHSPAQNKVSSKSAEGSKYAEGLEFPEEDEPDYLDFVYFSFVIGMTFQVSDVEISSKRIRRLALMHSLIAFAFNTVIVALSINIISGLLAK